MNKKLSQLVAFETVSKGQAIRKFLKTFYSTPSLIQRNSERLAQPKINLIYKLFTGFPLLYLPFQSRFAQPQKHAVDNLFTTCAPTISADLQNG